MKIATVVVFSALILIAGHLGAQVFVTNNVERAQAVKIASQLSVGMRQEDATKLLTQNGLTNSINLGSGFSWTLFYGLADGSSLGLSMRSSRPQPPKRVNGLLEAAFIQSNGVNIVLITLANRL